MVKICQYCAHERDCRALRGLDLCQRCSAKSPERYVIGEPSGGGEGYGVWDTKENRWALKPRHSLSEVRNLLRMSLNDWTT